MFEKEAEEYASRFWGKKESLDKACTIENFKDGAEFGYKKANEKYKELSKAVFELKGEFMACPLDDMDKLSELIDRLNNL